MRFYNSSTGLLPTRQPFPHVLCLCTEGVWLRTPQQCGTRDQHDNIPAFSLPSRHPLQLQRCVRCQSLLNAALLHIRCL